MQSYEYKIIPAPMRGVKARGLKSNEDRFAYSLELAVNELAAKGWEYLRAETLPCEERRGLTGRVTTIHQSMLVFRRSLATEAVAVPVQAAAGLAAVSRSPALVAAADQTVRAPRLNDVQFAAAPTLGPARPVAGPVAGLAQPPAPIFSAPRLKAE